MWECILGLEKTLYTQTWVRKNAVHTDMSIICSDSALQAAIFFVETRELLLAEIISTPHWAFF